MAITELENFAGQLNTKILTEVGTEAGSMSVDASVAFFGLHFSNMPSTMPLKLIKPIIFNQIWIIKIELISKPTLDQSK